MSSFAFKQFTIQQDQCAMKVGTDAVLLGAWAEAREGCLLDVGTGTGVIALMLAQRTAGSRIYGIEIDTAAAAQAGRNIEASPWSDRVTVINEDVCRWDNRVKYDEIVSNPPFYVNSPASSSLQRDTARKSSADFFSSLIGFAAQHLKDDGVFEVILPENEKDDFIFKCWKNNLFLMNQMLVCTRQGKKPKRALLRFSPVRSVAQYGTLVMTDANNVYTEDYRRLTADFYLNMNS